MKKLSITLLAIAAALLLIGCECDDQPTPCQSYEYKLVTCDTQDNVIKINNVWGTNSNLDPSNWQYLREVGFRLEAPNFTIVSNNGQKILDADLFNFDYPVYVHRPNDTTAVFYSTQMVEYLDNTDLFYVNLKLSK